MGTVCSCLQDNPQHQDSQIRPEDKKPMESKSEIQHIYHQNKFQMVSQLAGLYQRVINGETLRTIKISEQSLGNNGAQLLAGLFSYTPKVDQLILKDNELYQEGALEIADEIYQLRRLRKLKINNNFIGDAGLKAIINAVNIRNIEQLVLINNDITSKGVKDFQNILPNMKKLQYFYIPFNKISGRGLMKLVD